MESGPHLAWGPSLPGGTQFRPAGPPQRQNHQGFKQHQQGQQFRLPNMPNSPPNHLPPPAVYSQPGPIQTSTHGNAAIAPPSCGPQNQQRNNHHHHHHHHHPALANQQQAPHSGHRIPQHGPTHAMAGSMQHSAHPPRPPPSLPHYLDPLESQYYPEDMFYPQRVEFSNGAVLIIDPQTEEFVKSIDDELLSLPFSDWEVQNMLANAESFDAFMLRTNSCPATRRPVPVPGPSVLNGAQPVVNAGPYMSRTYAYPVTCGPVPGPSVLNRARPAAKIGGRWQ